MHGVLLLLTLAISPSREGEGFISRWKRGMAEDLRARFYFYLVAACAASLPTPQRAHCKLRGGKKEVLSQDLKTGSDSAARRETKQETTSQRSGVKDRAPRLDRPRTA